jgi:hypothetical protein
MAVPLLIAGAGLGLLVSQLNNYTLSPIEEKRVSEAAGVNSAGGSFGLSFGLAFAGAIMLASLSLIFTHLANESEVLSPAEQHQVAKGLEKNAEVLTNTHLEQLLAGQPADVKAEILHINTKARPRAPDRATRAAHRGPARSRQRLPDDPTARLGTLGSRRRDAVRVTRLAAHAPRQGATAGS